MEAVRTSTLTGTVVPAGTASRLCKAILTPVCSTVAEETKGERDRAKATKAMVNIVKETKMKGVYGYPKRKGYEDGGSGKERS